MLMLRSCQRTEKKRYTANLRRWQKQKENTGEGTSTGY